MANDKDFKVKNGIQATGYLEGTGTISTGSTSWDLAGAFYDDKSFSIASEEATPYGLWFKTDGTKMYVIGVSGDAVVEYDLSTAWDISTSSYNQEFSVSSQEGAPTGVAFKSDGTKMYIIGLNNDSVYQYALSTAWDVSTASYESKSFSTQTQIAYPMGLYFTSDGTKFYTCGYISDDAAQYTLSTAWDVSTASHTNTLDLATDESTLRGVALKPDGTKFYTIGSTTDTVRQYSLSTAYDLSTASYDDINFSVNAQQANPFGIFFKPDGTKFYITGNSGDSVYQYSISTTLKNLDLSTGSVFELTPTDKDKINLINPAASGTVSQATLLLEGGTKTAYDIDNASYDGKSFSVASQETYPYSVEFKSDGTKMYVIGNTNDTLYQYSLSTAWDVSTASYDSVSFSTSSQATIPMGLHFKPDGTKFYVTDNNDDYVYQYGLSTAWDISTASYDNKSFLYSSQSVQGREVYFKTDGTKMYLLEDTNNIVYQYSLSTAWDVSTASYDSVSFSVNSQDTTCFGLAFNSDGTKMFMVGQQNDTVYQYSLSTAWNISTASYDSISFSVQSQETNPNHITFKSDGTKFYIIGNSSDTVYQYSSAEVSTITYDSSIKFAGGTAPTARSEGLSVLTFSTRDYGTSYQAVLALDGAI
tara:strand:+ start:3082 stop:5016 length:1935 start_codon:yes stop_codon:yes gene_type:complete